MYVVSYNFEYSDSNGNDHSEVVDLGYYSTKSRAQYWQSIHSRIGVQTFIREVDFINPEWKTAADKKLANSRVFGKAYGLAKNPKQVLTLVGNMLKRPEVEEAIA